MKYCRQKEKNNKPEHIINSKNGKNIGAFLRIYGALKVRYNSHNIKSIIFEKSISNVLCRRRFLMISFQLAPASCSCSLITTN